MARLPDASSLGGLPSMRSGRPVATIDVSGYARAADAEAQGVRALGKGISDLGSGVGSFAAEEKRSANEQARKTDSLNEATSNAGYEADSIALNAEHDNETDPEVLAQYPQRRQALIDKWAPKTVDPQRTELWRLRRAPEVATQKVRADERIFGIQSDEAGAEQVRVNKTLMDVTPTAKDPAERERALATAQDLINKRLEAGYIDETQAEKERQQLVSGYSYNVFKAQPPGERITALTGGWEGRLISKESSGNPRVVNEWGYAGLYQFGAPLLSTLGLYRPGENEDLDGWSKSGKAAPGKWSGTFAIPGFPQVRTLEDFRNSPAAQKAAFNASLALYDKEIAERGLDRFIGQEVGGVPITREGLYSMMHLGGPAGADRALRSGGGSDARDANGATVLSYAAMAARGGNSQHPISQYLSPEQRRELEAGAYREIMVADRQEQQNRLVEEARVRTGIADDLASVERAGTGLPTVTRERIATSLGDEAARNWEQDRARALARHDALSGIESLPEGEVEQRLKSLEPVPGTEGYAAGMESYRKAREKADKFLEARRADPALAVDALPAVREARAGAQYQGDTDKRAITPEGAQSIVRARLTAQNQLGIAEPMAITRSEAGVLARRLREIGEDDTASLNRYLTSLRSTYGEYADEVLSATLQHQKVNRDLSVTATELLNKIAAGVPPSMVEARAVDNSRDIQANDAAIAGTAVPAAPFYSGFDIAPPQAALDAGKPAAPRPGEFTSTPTGEALRALDRNRNDPMELAVFNERYGKDTAQRALAELDRLLGRKPAKSAE